MNHLYEPLVAQDDVNNIGKMTESLVIEFDQAKLEKQRAQATEAIFEDTSSSR